MNRQNKRQTHGKFGFSGFVAKQVHSNGGSQTAAQGGYGQEGGFRDAPGIFLGPNLVRQHKQEGKRIDYKQVCVNHVHIWKPFWRDVL